MSIAGWTLVWRPMEGIVVKSFCLIDTGEEGVVDGGLRDPEELDEEAVSSDVAT